MSDVKDKVVRLDALVGKMVESTTPCASCGDCYAFIREGKGHELEARCSECGHLMNTLKRIDVDKISCRRCQNQRQDNVLRTYARQNVSNPNARGLEKIRGCVKLHTIVSQWVMLCATEYAKNHGPAQFEIERIRR